MIILTPADADRIVLAVVVVDASFVAYIAIRSSDPAAESGRHGAQSRLVFQSRKEPGMREAQCLLPSGEGIVLVVPDDRHRGVPLAAVIDIVQCSHFRGQRV